MTAAADALRPPSRTLLLLEGRAVQELGAFMLLRPWLAAAPRGDGHPVLVLPGLTAGDATTWPLRKFLEGRGYVVYPWNQGLNLGPREGVVHKLVARLRKISRDHHRNGDVVMTGRRC